MLRALSRYQALDNHINHPALVGQCLFIHPTKKNIVVTQKWYTKYILTLKICRKQKKVPGVKIAKRYIS